MLISVIGLIILFFIIAVSIYKINSQVKLKKIGAKLNQRLFIMISAIVLLPSLLFYLFMLDVMNRNIDSLHTIKIEKIIQDTIDLSKKSIDTALLAYKRRTELLVEDIVIAQKLESNPSKLLHTLRNRSDAYELSLFTRGVKYIAASTKDTFRLIPTLPDKKLMLQEKTSIKITKIKGYSYIQVITSVPISGKYIKPNILLALYPISDKIISLTNKISDAQQVYKKQDIIKSPLKEIFMTNMSLVLFFNVCIALLVILRSTRKTIQPLKEMSIATKKIASGNYNVKISYNVDDDFGMLASLFNNMADKIYVSQKEIEKSNKQLFEQKLYFETVLKYSYGIITIDLDKKIKLSNTIVNNILSINIDDFINKNFQEIPLKYPYLKPIFDLIDLNLNKCIYKWNKEIEISIPKQNARVIDCRCIGIKYSENILSGYIFVFNDITEQLKIQKQATWGEVARRLAHEFKNPLTPIQLSAERLEKKYLSFIDNTDNKNSFKKSTQTIIQQVDVLKKNGNGICGICKKCTI